MAQWFVEKNGQIEGPFTTEMVQNRLLSGTFDHGDKVWGRSMDEWRSLSWWAMSLQELSQRQRAVANPEVWHYAFEGATFGPFNWNILIHNLKGIRNNSIDQMVQIMIWTKGMKEWAPLLEFHEILQAIGVNKRDIPRAEVQGKVIVKSLGNVFVAPLRNIGEGGFGCDPTPGLTSGENVTVELQADAFKTAIHARAQVRYNTERLAGFKFIQINVEHKGAIVEFVKRSSGAERFFIKDEAA